MKQKLLYICIMSGLLLYANYVQSSDLRAYNKKNKSRQKSDHNIKNDNNTITISPITIGKDQIITNRQFEENDPIIFIGETLTPEDHVRENSLIKYNELFSNKRWRTKHITIDKFQEVSLGFSASLSLVSANQTYNNAKYYVEQQVESVINPQINLSVLRLIFSSLKNCLESNSIFVGDMQNLFNLCFLRKIHLWTSPSIDKTVVENNKKQLTNSTSNVLKNNVLQLFKNARNKLFQNILTQVKKFSSNVNTKNIDIVSISKPQVIINQDTIEEVKKFFLLFATAYNLHHEQYIESAILQNDFKDITEDDVLALVVPEQVMYLHSIKSYCKDIAEIVQKMEKTKEAILSSTDHTNIKDSIVFI